MRVGFRLAAVLLALTPLSAARAATAQAPGPTGECGVSCVLVRTVTAQATEVAQSVVLTGFVAAKFQTDVAFRTGGQITKRTVEVGDHVAANQVLAVLDPRDLTASVDTAKAGLASSQALLAQAVVTFDRQKALFADGNTTRPSFDAAQQQLRTQQAAVESGKALLGTAQEQLGYAELRSGVAGTVVGRSAEAGQVVQAGQTVFTLAQDGPRDAVFDVYEALVTEPPPSRTVKIVLQSDRSVATEGTVREISPSVDAQSGTVRVKIELNSVPERMSLGAAVIGSGSFKPQRAIVLPRGALFRSGGSAALWFYDAASRTVAVRPVTVARFEGDSLVVSDGVKPGDTVVTVGIQFLHPGQVVGVAEARP